MKTLNETSSYFEVIYYIHLRLSPYSANLAFLSLTSPPFNFNLCQNIMLANWEADDEFHGIIEIIKPPNKTKIRTFWRLA